MESYSVLSTVYINALVTASVNPLSDTVLFGFVIGNQVPTTWYAASWTPGQTSGSPYKCRCLIGPSPGVINLTPGTYTVWVKVLDNPETPLLVAGNIVLT